MRNSFITYSIFLALLIGFIPKAYGQDAPFTQKNKVEEVLNYIVKKEISVGKVRVDSISESNGLIHILMSENFSYYPFRENNVKHIYTSVARELGIENNNKLQIITANKLIEELIPEALRSKRNKKKKTFTYKKRKPLKTKIDAINSPTKGLSSKHIALWQSHGYYYEPKLTRWEWQRARIFQTVEDLYTQSYVLPFLVPMLENSGANVIMPRERDTQTHEVIIDNDSKTDGKSQYLEINGLNNWTTGSLKGFAHLKSYYIDNENPFRLGTYRETETIRKGQESRIEWIPHIPKSGEYAVYVSYKTVANSTEGAQYTVHHNGYESTYTINQTMGGGTWIYLDTFYFKEGSNKENKISLSNITSKKGEVITADAIKIGGGYGNIARSLSNKGASDNIKSSDKTSIQTQLITKNTTEYPYEVSGYPRFTEAARYWMQWAGIPDSIYTPSQGVNDYTDDYQCRGLWVNYLTGGTEANHNSKGLNIPIDLAFAFHTDAGTTFNDSIIGTLGIFRTSSYNGVYETGATRHIARDLTDLIQSQIVNDIRTLYHPDWTRRGMWDRAYSEASTPKVPTMLLELLSHQNFADMQFGLDPRFRFTVSRSIYKGILKHINTQYNTPYVVHPLPVEDMHIKFTSNNRIKIQWSSVEDILEPTAKPTGYIIYTRIGNNAFDKGQFIKSNTFETSIPTGVVCSFKVSAINEGGESFPSEILAVGRSQHSNKEVLVINGFTRISAPDDFDHQKDSVAGFLDDFDHGVPYIKDISYIGQMKEFRRTIPWMDDDASGFGDSYGNHETEVIAGNTFDYPALHGKSILKAGYSFTSTSKKAVEQDYIHLTDYPIVNLILGKEKQTKMGAGKNNIFEFKTFSPKLQNSIRSFCTQGGAILVSGAYVATDLWDNSLIESNEEDTKFAQEVLKFKWRVNKAAITGGVKEVASPYSKQNLTLKYNNKFDKDIYRVESPDAIEPADENSYTVLRYSENNLSAGIAYKNKYKTYVMGFPFETIKDSQARDSLMKTILDFLTE